MDPPPTATLADYGFPASSDGLDFSPEIARLQALRDHDVVARSPTPKPVFTLGTRASALAMIQTRAVKAELELKWPGVRFEIFGMVSATHP